MLSRANKFVLVFTVRMNISYKEVANYDGRNGDMHKLYAPKLFCFMYSDGQSYGTSEEWRLHGWPEEKLMLWQDLEASWVQKLDYWCLCLTKQMMLYYKFSHRKCYRPCNSDQFGLMKRSAVFSLYNTNYLDKNKNKIMYINK